MTTVNKAIGGGAAGLLTSALWAFLATTMFVMSLTMEQQAALQGLLGAAVGSLIVYLTPQNRRRELLAVALLLVLPGLASAQNLCASPNALVKNPNKFAFQTAQFTATAPDGTALVAQVEATYRKASDNSTVGTVTYPKTNFTLVSGTTDCYAANFVQPPGLNPNDTYTASVRLLSAGGAASPSATGNPFWWEGAPNAPGVIRMVKVAITSPKRLGVLAARGFSRRGPNSKPRGTSFAP